MGFNVEMGARTVWMEARNQPVEGQIAVAHVIANRLAAGKWGSTVAAIVLEPKQFSCWNTADTNREAMAHLNELDPDLDRMAGYIQDALSGASTDPTGGATFYFNPTVCKPLWASEFVKTANIGAHSFYKES